MILTGTGIINGLGNGVNYNLVAFPEGASNFNQLGPTIFSLDGITWVSGGSGSSYRIFTDKITDSLYSSISGNFIICAGELANTDGGIAYSSDGRNWSKIPFVGGMSRVFSLVETNNKDIPLIYTTLALGESAANTLVYYSTDGGLTFTQNTFATGVDNHISATAVWNEYYGLTISAGSGVFSVLYNIPDPLAPDYQDWIQLNIGTEDFIDSCYFSNSTNYWAVIISVGTIYYGDGITWTAATISGGLTLNSVAYSPTLGIAIAASSTTSYLVSNSEGTVWTPVVAGFPQVINRIIWSPVLVKFVAFGLTGITTSSDGTNWSSPISTPTDANPFTGQTGYVIGISK
jgi:hypothetical protein